MKTLKFETNINCNGCIAKVTPFFNQLEGIEKWTVNIAEPQKTLTVETNDLSEDDIISIVKSAGYNAQKI